MVDIFSIGRSGIQAYKQALAVTGENIANVNTEGYRRRQVDVAEVPTYRLGVDSVDLTGMGVRVEGVRRSFDQYLTARMNVAQSEFQRGQNYLQTLKQIENYILPIDSDVGHFMQEFFASLQEVSSDPASIAARVVSLEAGKNMVLSFAQMGNNLDDLQQHIAAQADELGQELNRLVLELSRVNKNLTGVGIENSILDLRDKLVTEIAGLIGVDASYDQSGAAILRLANDSAGSFLVSKLDAKSIRVAPSENQLTLFLGDKAISPIGGGKTGSLQQAYDFIVELQKDIDGLAHRLVDGINAFHRQGLDLEGKPGTDMFSGDTAANMKFLLTRPEEIAAAAKFVTSPDIHNQSQADIEFLGDDLLKSASLPLLDQIFGSQLSPITARSFLRDGVIAQIPEDVQQVRFNSYAQQAQLKITLSEAMLADGAKLQINLQDQDGINTYRFDLSGVTTPKALAEALNHGVIRSDEGYSLVDLELYATMANGDLVISSADDRFVGENSISTSAGIEIGRIQAPQEASQIQIFTREGRHIAGAPLASEDIAAFMTVENGFLEQAVYRDDDLNGDYRDIEIESVGLVSHVIEENRQTIRFHPDTASNENVAIENGRVIAASGAYRLDIVVDENTSFSAEIAADGLAGARGEDVAAALLTQLRSQAPVTKLIADKTVNIDDGETLSFYFGDESHSLTYADGEFTFSGKDADYMYAQFTDDGRVEILARGGLSGQRLSLAQGDGGHFGFSEPVQELIGAEIQRPQSTRSMPFSWNGQSGHIELTAAGEIDVIPPFQGLTARWVDSEFGKGRIILSMPASAQDAFILSPAPQAVALGFKTISGEIGQNGDTIYIENTGLNVTAEAKGLRGQELVLRNLPEEDLLVFISGEGARIMAAEYDLAPPLKMPPQFDFIATEDQIEIFDAITGHNIATRKTDAEGYFSVMGHKFEAHGKMLAGDKFYFRENVSGISDARNVRNILSLQSDNLYGDGQKGLQTEFSEILMQVSGAVQGAKITADQGKAHYDAAVAAEDVFSGVNLDEEAAALLQYQQAYQASARILTTARELFSTILEL